jgi:L-arabinose isomerase
VSVAGEDEVKSARAMKIRDLLGVGGSFTKNDTMDFPDEVGLMGRDGPGHLALAPGKSKVRPPKVDHGKLGRGVSVELAVRHGPVTLRSVIEAEGGKLALWGGEVDSVPGPIRAVGNTNRRSRFAGGARECVNRWNAHSPAQHGAVGVGPSADRFAKCGALRRARRRAPGVNPAALAAGVPR